MRLIIIVLLLFLIDSCDIPDNRTQIEAETTGTANNIRGPSNPPDLKCNIQKVADAESQMDSLTFSIVQDFLLTFDTTCINNVEYSEWSNEVLFNVLTKNPELFFEVISAAKIDNKAILHELRTPIRDLIDLSETYERVDKIPLPIELKKKYLTAICIAAKETGQTLGIKNAY